MALNSDFQDPGTDPVYSHPAGGMNVAGLQPATTSPAMAPPPKDQDEGGGIMGTAVKAAGSPGGAAATNTGSGASLGDQGPGGSASL